MVTLTLERRAGRRAIRGFGRVLATIDEMIRRRHDRCQESIETAAGFGVKLRAKAAAERMKAMLKRVRDALGNFPGYAKIRRVLLLLDPWTIDNGLMTPTLKFRRNRVIDQYNDEIARLYESGT